MICEVLAAHEGWRRRKSFAPPGTVLLGDLVIADRTGATNTFSMEVLVPKKFPAPRVHPRARVLKHDLEKTLTAEAHVEPDGALCLQLPERNEIDYAVVGLAGFMQHVVLHLHRARIWSLGLPYPGPEYAHAEEGRREYETQFRSLLAPYERLRSGLPEGLARLVDPETMLPSEKNKCPCGSTAAFADCHRELVVDRRTAWKRLGPVPQPPAGVSAK